MENNIRKDPVSPRSFRQERRAERQRICLPVHLLEEQTDP